MRKPKFIVPFQDMEQLFSLKGIFHNSQKELLSPEIIYYITKSEDNKYLLLAMEVDKEVNVLTALPWEGGYDNMTNPWLKKINEDPNQLELALETVPIIKKHYGPLVNS